VGLLHVLWQEYRAQVPILLLIGPHLISWLPAVIFFARLFSFLEKKACGHEVLGEKKEIFFFCFLFIPSSEHPTTALTRRQLLSYLQDRV